MKNNNFTLFIDLDGTVYDKHNGMWEEMSARIDEYMRSAIGIPEYEVVQIREKYYKRYGSTLRGIQTHHNIDSEEYLAFVHDLDLAKFLSPDPDLRYKLESIPYPKWIFTNSDRNHTQRVLKFLGLEDLFEDILDVWSMFYIPKPERWTYRNAMALAGNPDPRNCIFIDDTLKNLAPPKAMGWHTVWVDSYTFHPTASYSIPKLGCLPEVINQIEARQWNNENYLQTSKLLEGNARTLDWRRI
jgi:putative hydrolase of the HAD superfamily